MERTPQQLSDADAVKAIEIRRICSKNGVFLNNEQLSGLAQFVQLVREWNSKLNLISRRDLENIWESHILHSLSIVFEQDLPIGGKVLDLGTGGGFPGIPLKIVRPDLLLTLLDATRKKSEAVASMVEEIGLRQTTVVWGRGEEASIIARLAGAFDRIVARAVAPLPDLVKWSRPLLRPDNADDPQGPKLIALKGGNLEAEVRGVRGLSYVREVRTKDLTFSGAETIPGVEKKIVTVFFDLRERPNT